MNKLILSLFLAINYLLVPFLCYGAAATMYVTVAGAGDKSGSSWTNAMGFSEWETDVESGQEASDVYYIEEGTYTLTSALTKSANNVSYIGVKSGTTNEGASIVAADLTYGTGRPVIACGAYSASFNGRIHGLQFTGTATTVATTVGRILHCKANNSSGAAWRKAFYAGGVSYNFWLYNELQSTAGYALYAALGDKIIKNYIHDSIRGVYGASYAQFINNVLDTCTDCTHTVGANTIFSGNTFYNCSGTAISAGSSVILVYDNIFDNNGTGVSSTGYSFSDFNLYSNNTTDVSGVSLGKNDIVEDVTIANAASGDFTMPTTSPTIDATHTVDGLSGNYLWNIGFDQTDIQSGGGGSSAETTLILNGVTIN